MVAGEKSTILCTDPFTDPDINRSSMGREFCSLLVQHQTPDCLNRVVDQSLIFKGVPLKSTVVTGPLGITRMVN